MCGPVSSPGCDRVVAAGYTYRERELPDARPENGTGTLVRLDGTEEFLPGRSVRYSGQTHVMVAVGSPVEYFWLLKVDVTDAE